MALRLVEQLTQYLPAELDPRDPRIEQAAKQLQGAVATFFQEAGDTVWRSRTPCTAPGWVTRSTRP